MFSSKHGSGFVDFSLDLSEASDWKAGLLTSLDYHLDITALTTDPVSGLFAIGTARGVIYIYGSPGVECRLTLSDPPGLRVKFLQLAASVFKLLAVDEHERLHVWDLASFGKPKLQKLVSFPQPINCLVLSPSHSHAFLALGSGEIRTYDLLCLRTSTYVVPNLWALYESKMFSANAAATDISDSDIIVDVVIHPRDLNLLFIAYGGGVILSDLKAQNTVRAYELLLPPGAPGGNGYHHQDILTHRRPSVTTIAVHPSGHVLAVGHTDGTIAFWALEDEDRPLLLRTLDSSDSEDLSTVDATKLESTSTPAVPREPIFKLAWSSFPNSSDPRGGETVLTVLGGLAIDALPGLTALLLPPLNPPAPPSPTSPQNQATTQPALHPDTRASMRAALAVRDVHIYPSPGAVQDFLLFPRTSPHFAGAYDPSAVLIVSDSEVVDARVTQAFEFPPPAFFPPATSSNVTKVPDPQDTTDEAGLQAQLEEELQSTLQSMSLTTDPRPVRLPPSLWSVLGESLVKLEKDAYEVLIREKHCDIEGEEALPIKGGVAWIEDTEGQMKLMKLQPHRVLITHHPDLSLRFLDLSAQLLVSSGPEAPLQSSFPSPLPTLTIELAPLLIDHSLGLSNLPIPSDPGSSTQIKERVEAVHFAPESLECIVVLRSGAVVLLRLDMLSSGIAYGTQEMQDEELVSLAHTCVRDGLRFCPVFGVKPHKKRGPVSACAISDIGFLAIAYQSGALLLVDLRGPHVILRSDANASGERSSFLHRHSQLEPIVSLTWAVCRLSTDQTPHIRLFAIAPSGLTSIYTIVHAPPSSWTVSNPALAIESVPRPLPCASFVLDAKTGVQCRANRRGLSAVLKAAEGQVFDEDGRESLGTKGTVWVSAGAKGARCTANVNGERIARVEWGSKVGTVQHVEVVEKNGSCVLVVFTDQGVALVYSLPLLEHMHSLQLPSSRSSDPPSTDNTGDYVTHVPFPSASGSAPRLLLHTDLQTLFALRRTAPYAPPTVDLSSARGTVPAQPQPVSLAPASMLGSLLGYIGGLAGGTGGEQVDALLGGPDRPAVPQSGTTAGRPRQLSPKDPSGRLSPSSVEQSSVASTSASVTSGVSDLYNRLGTALAERGQMLGDLQESFDSLEQGSKNMLSQAKNMATQQSVKRWFNFS